MPTGSFTYTPDSPILSAMATPVLVFKRSAGSEDQGQFILMPNVWCESVEYRQGPTPPAAYLSYIMDDVATAMGWPNHFEELLPINGTPSPYAFVNDDEVAVIALMPDGTPTALFHGFAQAPQVHLTGSTEQVTFLAVGVPIREFDVPISYRHQRQNNALDNDVAGTGEDGTDVGAGTFNSLRAPARFNPDNKGNCIPPVALDENRGEKSYHPIFTDVGLWTYYKDANTDQPALWSLAQFAQYVCWVYNANEDWVKNPSSQSLDALLVTKKPKNEGGFFDPTDSSTYDVKPCIIPDFDATHSVWPEALHQMLMIHGFDMIWQTTLVDLEAGDIQTTLLPYRKDQSGPWDPKDIFLPPEGTFTSDQFANAASVTLAWDLASVRNAVEVEMQREVFEYSFLLAPNFKPGPAGDAQNKTFLASSPEYQSGKTAKNYREFVIGDGNTQYWDYIAKDFKRTKVNFNQAYYAPDPNQDPIYQGPKVQALFEPISTLVAKDPSGNALSARLEVWRSEGVGQQQGVFGGQDGVGIVFGRDDDEISPPGYGTGPTDQGVWEIIESGWELLDGRMGVRFTVENPENDVKTASNVRLPLISGAGVTSDDPKAYMLRLTVAMYSPERVPVYQGMRPASPTRYPRWLVVDRQDQHQLEVQWIAKEDVLNTDGTGFEVYKTDDYDEASDEGDAIRSRSEFPPLSGSVTIPALSLSYQVADRIRSINGRNISLRSNIGDDREAPQYPYVVSVQFNFSSESQTTTLTLSDHRDAGFRAQPATRRRRRQRPRRGIPDHRVVPGQLGARGQPAIGADMMQRAALENAPGFVGPPAFAGGGARGGARPDVPQPGQPGVKPNTPVRFQRQPSREPFTPTPGHGMPLGEGQMQGAGGGMMGEEGAGGNASPAYQAYLKRMRGQQGAPAPEAAQSQLAAPSSQPQQPGRVRPNVPPVLHGTPGQGGVRPNTPARFQRQPSRGPFTPKPGQGQPLGEGQLQGEGGGMTVETGAGGAGSPAYQAYLKRMKGQQNPGS